MNEYVNDIKHSRNKPALNILINRIICWKILTYQLSKKVKGTTKQQGKVEKHNKIFKFDCVNEGLKRDYSFNASLCMIFICMNVSVS